MWCAKRAHPPLLQLQALITDRSDGRGLQGLVLVHGREDGGQAAGQHRLAGAWRTDHQQVMAAGGGDFQGAFGVMLAAHIGNLSSRSAW